MLHPSCKVSDTFPYHFKISRSDYLPGFVAGKDEHRVWCFTIEWPSVNVSRSNINSTEVCPDGTVLLQVS